jgi:hypothetical protein
MTGNQNTLIYSLSATIFNELKRFAILGIYNNFFVFIFRKLNNRVHKRFLTGSNVTPCQVLVLGGLVTLTIEEKSL